MLSQNIYPSSRKYMTLIRKCYRSSIQTCGITNVSLSHPFYSPSYKIGCLLNDQKVYCTSSNRQNNLAKHKEHVTKEFKIYIEQNKEKLRDTEQRLKEKKHALLQDFKETRDKVKVKVEEIIEVATIQIFF